MSRSTTLLDFFCLLRYGSHARVRRCQTLISLDFHAPVERPHVGDVSFRAVRISPSEQFCQRARHAFTEPFYGQFYIVDPR